MIDLIVRSRILTEAERVDICLQQSGKNGFSNFFRTGVICKHFQFVMK